MPIDLPPPTPSHPTAKPAPPLSVGPGPWQKIIISTSRSEPLAQWFLPGRIGPSGSPKVTNNLEEPIRTNKAAHDGAGIPFERGGRETANSLIVCSASSSLARVVGAVASIFVGAARLRGNLWAEAAYRNLRAEAADRNLRAEAPRERERAGSARQSII